MVISGEEPQYPSLHLHPVLLEMFGSAFGSMHAVQELAWLQLEHSWLQAVQELEEVSRPAPQNPTSQRQPIPVLRFGEEFAAMQDIQVLAREQLRHSA